MIRHSYIKPENLPGLPSTIPQGAVYLQATKAGEKQINIHRFTVMSFLLSVAANTFDLPPLNHVHVHVKHVLPC